jgi:hypothetical protein
MKCMVDICLELQQIIHNFCKNLLQILYKSVCYKPSQNFLYITKISIPASTGREWGKYKILCQLEFEPKSSHVRTMSFILILQLAKYSNTPLSALFAQIKAGVRNLKIKNKIIRTYIWINY